MSTYFADPDYDRMLDAQMEARFADEDAYEEFCNANGLGPEDDNTEAWEAFKWSCAEADMELSLAQEAQERMDMCAEWYE